MLTFEPVDPRDPAARAALLAYVEETAALLAEPALTPDSAGDVNDFRQPEGTFLLARDRHGRVAGCGGVRPLEGGVAEIKRMWVHPAYRGHGWGGELLGVLEEFCRDRGYGAVRLDTNRSLTVASALYASRGYRLIERYNDNPDATHFYEKALGPPVPAEVAAEGRPINDPRWDAWTPAEVARRLEGVPVPWAVAGGWSLDLFLGHETRPHDDLEIAVPAGGFPALSAALRELSFDVVGGGSAYPLESAAFAVMFQTWGRDRGADGPYRVDVFREPHDGGTWICRRYPRIRLPYRQVVRWSEGGIPYQSPEIGLLFKAKHARDEDDLAAVLPALDADQRRWLAASVARVHPGHRWLDGVLRVTERRPPPR